ncbi:MAG: ImmA/IrrE family metallo-endopeptidase [Candidatus Omnitrophica bacterium]|nr:ImmA/IrrE family metallo-endopeptidase [Candidatus Omnitrophota bacterium]
MKENKIAVNLKRIRIARGLTMEKAAEAAGITRMAYHNIEKGIAEPRVSNLQKLADALGVKVFDLARSVPKLSNVRFRALKWKTQKSKQKREEIKNETALWMRDFRDLEELLLNGKDNKACLDNQKYDLNSMSPEKAADKARKCLGLKGDEVITDICGLVESAGIKLHFMNIGLENFFGFSVNDKELGAAIVVNSHESIPTERKIFTVAHELGHILMHPDSFNDDEEEIKVQEDEANAFASYFLMPSIAFHKRLSEIKGLDSVDIILHIKRVFKVSYMTVIKRLIGERVATNDIYKTFCYRYKERKSFEFKGHKEPEPLAPIDCIEDRLSRLVREAYEKELVSMSRAAEILGKSIVDMRDLVNGWMAVK